MISAVISITVQATEQKNIFRRGTQAELRSLDPQFVVGNSAGAMMYDLFEGLVSVNANGELEPGAAKSWVISDDGLTYTFKLREGLRWSDGAPLGAQDFVYSLRRIVNPENALRGAGTIFPILNARAINRGDKLTTELGVRALDALTLEITLGSPAPFFIDMLAGYPASAIPRHAIEEHGTQWSMPGNMVTSGAYVLVEWLSNTHYKLVKNPYYREAEKVQIDAVYYYPIPDKDTAVKRYRANELDVTLNVPLTRLEWFRKNMPEETKTSTSSGLKYLIINTKRPPLDDVRVRQALSISMNRKVIAEKILRDGSPPITNLVPAEMPNYGPNPASFAEQPYDQRAEEAKHLLADAGFSASHPLRFNFEVLPGEKPRRVAVALQAMWRSIGAEAKLVNIGSQGYRKLLRTGDFSVAWYTYFAPYSDATAFLLLLRSESLQNYSGYNNPEFDRLLSAANDITDVHSRATYLRQAEQLALADYPLIPLYTPARVYLVSKRVQGWMNHNQPHLARHLSIIN